MTSSSKSNPQDPQRESLIEYPSRFPIKVMGAKVDGFVHAVTTIARQFDPSFDAASVELREPGVYPYFCNRHQSMRGEIRVK